MKGEKMRQRKKERGMDARRAGKKSLRQIDTSLFLHPSPHHHPPLFFFFFEFPPFSVFGHSATFSLLSFGRPNKGERESSQSARSQANYPCNESFSWISPLVLLSIL